MLAVVVKSADKLRQSLLKIKRNWSLPEEMLDTVVFGVIAFATMTPETPVKARFS
jgi:Ca2+/Na+ antiporter